MDEQQIQEIVAVRNKAGQGHPSTTHWGNAEMIESMGAIAEDAFARCFGFKVRAQTKDEWGDGKIDFTARFKLGALTLDMKCSKYASLRIKVDEIKQCANILVVADFVPAKVGLGIATMIGWDTKNIVAFSPVIDFGHGPCYFRPASELRPLAQLCNLLSRRIE